MDLEEGAYRARAEECNEKSLEGGVLADGGRG